MPIVKQQTRQTNDESSLLKEQSTSPVVHELWPKLKDSKDPPARDEDEDWEYISSSSSSSVNAPSANDAKDKNQASSSTTSEAKEDGEDLEDHSLIHRCESTPEFSSFSSFGSIQASDDDLSYVVDCGSSVDAQSIQTTHDDTVLLSLKKDIGNGAIKKVPSFKDMLLINSQKIQEEDQRKKEQLKELEEKRRKEAIQRRKTTRTRLVVTPIKRCAKSTGDLRSLVIHEEEEGYGGGGSGFGSAVIHEEEEVLGCTDAMEYYNRKDVGRKGRMNGLKTRPDEAKRKEMIIHKKNAQRRAQGIHT